MLANTCQVCIPAQTTCVLLPSVAYLFVLKICRIMYKKSHPARSAKFNFCYHMSMADLPYYIIAGMMAELNGGDATIINKLLVLSSVLEGLDSMVLFANSLTLFGYYVGRLAICALICYATFLPY
ncbi:hypothetical protein GGS20DRAFT_587856 [Poronia punctata]|nr:hypothetical protein GGS20DRAFT_587856 [Poronia punctata]